jgi:hypothetical protein
MSMASTRCSTARPGQPIHQQGHFFRMPLCNCHLHRWGDTDIAIGINVLRPMSKVIDFKKPLQIRGDSNQTLNNKEEKLGI